MRPLRTIYMASPVCLVRSTIPPGTHWFLPGCTISCLVNWLPAITSTGVLAIIVAAVGVAYRRAMDAAITHAFDRKLEKLRAEHKEREQRLSDELTRRAAEIDALRSGALASLAARHIEMAKRRIAAVDHVWTHVVEVANLKALAKNSQVLNFDNFFKAAELGGDSFANTARFADIMLKIAGIDPGLSKHKKYDNTADKDRPFLPEITWALFIAYRQIVSRPFFMIQAIKAGIGKSIMADPAVMMDLAKKALPHQSAFIDQNGADSLIYIVDELEDTLLRSLRDALSHADADEAAVAQASQIMAAVSVVEKKRVADAPLPKPPDGVAMS
jgi:hypothetical protein